MKPSRKILGIRLRNFDSGISKEMNWVGAILDYLDEQAESQEPKASEEYGETWCACSMFGEVHKKSSHIKAKPQDEPKKTDCICNQFCRDWPIHPMYTWERCKCPCHQKETEPKEDPISTMVEEIAKAESKRIDGQYIILPRPKGKKTIAELIDDFNEWCQLSEIYGVWKYSDEEYLRLWSKFIKSQE